MGPKSYLSGHKASQTHPQTLIRCFLRSLRQGQAQFSFSNKEYHTLYSELASFTVPCRSFQISLQKSTTSFSLVAAERPSPFVDIT